MQPSLSHGVLLSCLVTMKWLNGRLKLDISLIIDNGVCFRNVKPQSKLSGALRSTSHACQLRIEGHVHVETVGESPATHSQKLYPEKPRIDELLSGVLAQ